MFSAADLLPSPLVLVYGVILARWQGFVSAEVSASSFLQLSEVLRFSQGNAGADVNITCNQLSVLLKQPTFEPDSPCSFSPTAPSTIQPKSPQIVFQGTMGKLPKMNPSCLHFS